MQLPYLRTFEFETFFPKRQPSMLFYEFLEPNRNVAFDNPPKEFNHVNIRTKCVYIERKRYIKILI